MSRFTFTYNGEELKIKGMVYRATNHDETYFGEELRQKEIKNLVFALPNTKVYTDTGSFKNNKEDEIGVVTCTSMDKEGNLWAIVDLYAHHSFVQNKIKTGEYTGFLFHMSVCRDKDTEDIYDEIADVGLCIIKENTLLPPFTIVHPPPPTTRRQKCYEMAVLIGGVSSMLFIVLACPMFQDGKCLGW